MSSSASDPAGITPASERLLELLRRPMLCDGAMGTEILARGVPFERCFEELNLSRPDLILEIHRRYVEAGAEIVETNTFGANRFRLVEHGLEASVGALNGAGVALARRAAEEVGHTRVCPTRKVSVAGSVGPLGVRLRPLGRLHAAQARDAFREQIRALAEPPVDLLILETFSDLNEIREAVLAAREVAPELPLVALMTFSEHGRTPLGDPPEAVAATLNELRVDALGANCSVGPARLLPVVERLVESAGKTPVGVMPNAGWPERAGSRLIYPATPEYLAEYARRFLVAGAKLIGGCCGVTPDHIRAMRAAIDGVHARCLR